MCLFFFFNDTATTEIYTLSLHDALPIASGPSGADPVILMLHQFRYAAAGPLWEIPAGTLAPGETPEACARRELLEEAGVAAQHLEPLTSIWTTQGSGH